MLAPLLVVSLWEVGWYLRRRHERGRLYEKSVERARQLGRPLVVVGAPDAHVTANYGCGDLVVDLLPSQCAASMQADITKPLPFEDDSVVVFCSCVLEYVDDFPSALKELRRISGGHLFVVRVEPWTATAYLYPHARRVVPGGIVGSPSPSPGAESMLRRSTRTFGRRDTSLALHTPRDLP